MKHALLLVTAALGCGCVRFQPRPLDPPRLEAGYRARSLADPGFRAFVEANTTSKPTPGPPAALDLATSTLVALYFSPELDVARTHVAIAEAARITARARPNPTVGVASGYTDLLESPYLFKFSFDLLIETAGKRKYRAAGAEHRAEAARLALADAAWKIRSRVRASLLDHLLALREVDLLRAEEAVRLQSVNLIQARFNAGDLARPDVESARIEVNAVRLALLTADSRTAETRVALAAALGLPVAALDSVRFEWPDLDRPPTEDAVTSLAVQRAGLLNRIDVRRALAEYAAIESALQLEIARQRPDISLGPAYSFDDAANKYTLGISLPVPLFHHNEGPIAEAEARRQEAAARFLVLQAQVITETDSALARYHSARAELSEAESNWLSQQNAREKSVLRAFEAGHTDRLALTAARLQTALAARARLDALRRTQLALGALEDALQRPLDPLANASGSVPGVDSTGALPSRDRQGVPMGLRPTQGDEKQGLRGVGFSPRGASAPLPASRAEARLRPKGRPTGQFFNGAAP